MAELEFGLPGRVRLQDYRDANAISARTLMRQDRCWSSAEPDARPHFMDSPRVRPAQAGITAMLGSSDSMKILLLGFGSGMTTARR